MKRSERIRIAHEACEDVEVNQGGSCLSVKRASGDFYYWETDYAVFWEQVLGRELSGCDFDHWKDGDDHRRILAILTWAYMPDSARKGIV